MKVKTFSISGKLKNNMYSCRFSHTDLTTFIRNLKKVQSEFFHNEEKRGKTK